jgi:general secretion pathway protein D
MPSQLLVAPTEETLVQPAPMVGQQPGVPTNNVPATAGVTAPQSQTQPQTTVAQVTQPSAPPTAPDLPTEPPKTPSSPITQATAETPSPEKTTAKNDEKKDIYLNFENADLTGFVNWLAEIKKLNIIPDKSLEGSKISLTIRNPLSIEGAWNISQTVLDMAGFCIIQKGDVYVVIPKDKKINQPLPAYINTPYAQLPDSDETIRYVMFLTNIQASSVRPIVESMMSAQGVIHDQADMNAFILVDKSYNVKAAAKLLTELDQMGLPETVTVLRLKRVNATDAKTLLDSLIKDTTDTNPLARLLGKAAEGGTKYFSSTTRVIAEERTNSLILLGNNKSIEKIIEFMTKHIDTDLESAASPLHVYELQHIDAKQAAEVLTEVTKMPDSASGSTAGKFGSIRGGVKYFRNMTFQVDTDGNRLLVSCVDKQDWKLLKKTLADLDKPQPQVAIEIFIVSIDADDQKTLGGLIRNKRHGLLGKNLDAHGAIPTETPFLEYDSNNTPISILGNLLQQLPSQVGQTVLTFGPQKNIWAFLEAVRQETNTSILSQPFIVAANKTAATLVLGETRRVVQDEAQATLKGYGDLGAETTISLIPQINLDGIIRLDVTVDMNEFEPNTDNARNQRKVKTNVSVADGQVLVLGGFVQTRVDEFKAKTPILGDIPILGWFFKHQERRVTKQYIFVFMAPTIIKPRQTPGMQLYTKMKLHQATENIEAAIETKTTLDPIHNWFFNPKVSPGNKPENYSHKVIDFANARYQPTTVDIKQDPYYRALSSKEEDEGVESKPVELPSTQPPPQAPQQVATEAPAITQPINLEESDLNERRKKLKDLLSNTPLNDGKKANPENTPTPAPVMSEKTPPSQSAEQITAEKRNVLKEFLSGKPETTKVAA